MQSSLGSCAPRKEIARSIILRSITVGLHQAVEVYLTWVKLIVRRPANACESTNLCIRYTGACGACYNGFGFPVWTEQDAGTAVGVFSITTPCGEARACDVLHHRSSESLPLHRAISARRCATMRCLFRQPLTTSEIQERIDAPPKSETVQIAGCALRYVLRMYVCMYVMVFCIERIFTHS